MHTIELGAPIKWKSNTWLSTWAARTWGHQDMLWVRDQHRLAAARGADFLYSSTSMLPYIQKHVRNSVGIKEGELSKELDERLDMLVRAMVGGPKKPVVTLFAYMLRKLWRRMFDSISAEVQALQAVQKALQRKQVPVVVMPTHRSFADFLILSYLMYATGLPLPHIAAKDDMAGWGPVSSLLRHSGAFFLRRDARRDKDQLYQSVFAAYVEYLICTQPMFEFYIEGSRSKDGKMLEPRMGLLSSVCTCFFEQKVIVL